MYRQVKQRFSISSWADLAFYWVCTFSLKPSVSFCINHLNTTNWNLCSSWSVKNPNLITVAYTTEKVSLRDEQELLYQPSQGLSGKSQLCLNLTVHDHRWLTCHVEVYGFKLSHTTTLKLDLARTCSAISLSSPLWFVMGIEMLHYSCAAEAPAKLSPG